MQSTVFCPASVDPQATGFVGFPPTEKVAWTPTLAGCKVVMIVYEKKVSKRTHYEFYIQFFTFSNSL